MLKRRIWGIKKTIWLGIGGKIQSGNSTKSSVVRGRKRGEEGRRLRRRDINGGEKRSLQKRRTRIARKKASRKEKIRRKRKKTFTGRGRNIEKEEISRVRLCKRETCRNKKAMKMYEK